MKAIQDHYPAEFAHCYGCGPANPHGLHLKSHLDGEGTVARATPDPMFSGGVPGNLYGGMIASLLDCHGTASAAAFACRARGRVIRGRLVALDGRKAKRLRRGSKLLASQPVTIPASATAP